MASYALRKKTNNFSEIFFYLPNIFKDIQGKLGNFFNI